MMRFQYFRGNGYGPLRIASPPTPPKEKNNIISVHEFAKSVILVKEF